MKTLSSTSDTSQAVLTPCPNVLGVDKLDNEGRIAQIRDRHWTMLVLASAVLLLSFLFSIRGEGTNATISLGSTELPPLCGSRVLFGTNCPGCGLTRSFVAIAKGNLSQSFEFHRVGWLLWLAVVLQVPYRIYGLFRLQRPIPESRWTTRFGYVLIIALIGNWFLQLLGW